MAISFEAMNNLQYFCMGIMAACTIGYVIQTVCFFFFIKRKKERFKQYLKDCPQDGN